MTGEYTTHDIMHGQRSPAQYLWQLLVLMCLGACCTRISRQKLLRRLRREIDTLRALDGCPSSIAFEGAFETEGHVYLIMEVCHGGDLETLLKVRFSSIAPFPCHIAGLRSSAGVLGMRTLASTNSTAVESSQSAKGQAASNYDCTPSMLPVLWRLAKPHCRAVGGSKGEIPLAMNTGEPCCFSTAEHQVLCKCRRAGRWGSGTRRWRCGRCCGWCAPATPPASSTATSSPATSCWRPATRCARVRL